MFKNFLILLICFFTTVPVFAEVSAPALQYLKEDYPSEIGRASCRERVWLKV